MLLFSSYPCKWLSPSQAEASICLGGKRAREKARNRWSSRFLFGLTYKTVLFLRFKRGSLKALSHTQGLYCNHGIGHRMWHIAHSPRSCRRMASAFRLFWDLVNMIHVDTFPPRPWTRILITPATLKEGRGLWSPAGDGSGKEQPSTKT